MVAKIGNEVPGSPGRGFDNMEIKTNYEKLEGKMKNWEKYAAFYTPKNVEMLDHMCACSKLNNKILKHVFNKLRQKSKINASDPSLPEQCPNCGQPVTPSKIDDRVVGCKVCKTMYCTKAAMDDPNIQRDIVHTRAGIQRYMKENFGG